MNHSTNRRLETLIYAGLWLLAMTVFLLNIMRARAYTSLPLLDMAVVERTAYVMITFLILFAVNNYLLIPKLLFRNRYGTYFLTATLLVLIIWIWQRYQFVSFIEGESVPRHPGPPHHEPHPMLPLPLFLDVIYDLLIVGCNLAIALIFRHFDDTLEHEKLMKENAMNQLTYLKAQINPHFYMNMLNNIHGMIEINPVKAQDMVIEMSGLMRYMLYESTRPEIALWAEIGFIRNYLSLMRERYPEDSVSISVDLPDEHDAAGVSVPPLLFLVFIENAFKHGISYNGGSYVSVHLEVAHDRVEFQCMNSVFPGEKSKSHEGIGLDNVRRRLDLIYGNRYTLDIDNTASVYSVNLTLPQYENKDSCNR